MVSCGLKMLIKVFNNPISVILKFNKEMTGFSIDQMIRWHPNLSFKGSLIGPESVSEAHGPILSAATNHFRKNLLDATIENFDLATILRMIRESSLESDTILFQEVFEGFIAKMWLAVANDSTGNSKTCKDGLFEDFNDKMLVMRPNRNDFMKSMPHTSKISTIRTGVGGISSRWEKRPRFWQFAQALQYKCASRKREG